MAGCAVNATLSATAAIMALPATDERTVKTAVPLLSVVACDGEMTAAVKDEDRVTVLPPRPTDEAFRTTTVTVAAWLPSAATFARSTVTNEDVADTIALGFVGESETVWLLADPLVIDRLPVAC